MNAIACSFARAKEPEATSISRGLRRRDPQVLDALIEQYQHRLLRYLVYLSGNRELAEDLFQETWVRVMERGHQYNGRYEFSTWLYAVARNLTIDYLRRKNPLSLDTLLTDNHDHAEFEPADRSASSWDLVAGHQRSEHLRAALARIPAVYREAIVLRFQEELALEQIAVVTGAPLGTVKSRVYRALTLLTKYLEEQSL